MEEFFRVEAILAVIPPKDRDRITARLWATCGPFDNWTLAALADACR